MDPAPPVLAERVFAMHTLLSGLDGHELATAALELLAPAGEACAAVVPPAAT